MGKKKCFRFWIMLLFLAVSVSCYKNNPIKTMNVHVRESYIISDEPVAEFYGSVKGDFWGYSVRILYAPVLEDLWVFGKESTVESVGVYWGGEISEDGSFTVKSNKLEVDTKYYYCWYINVAGTKYYGEVQEFTTCHPYKHTVELDMDSATDLSEPEPANCYVVTEPGLYKFRTLEGNTEKPLDGVASCLVLWESFGTDKTPKVFDIIGPTCYEDGYIAFTVPEAFNVGNASIAATDEYGEILWSWHIWLTDEPKEQVYFNDAGVMMDRNLGAGASTADGLFYQWGRKDPFMGPGYAFRSTASTVSWPSVIDASMTTGRIQYATSHPTTFIREGFSAYGGYRYLIDGAYWSESDLPKSVYDPCPAGWRVPDGGEEGVWAKAAGASYTSYEGIVEGGMEFSGTLGADPDIWYPYSGYSYLELYYSIPSLPHFDDVGQMGYYWTASKRNTVSAFNLSLYVRSDQGHSEVYADFVKSSFFVLHACPVRCIRDEI